MVTHSVKRNGTGSLSILFAGLFFAALFMIFSCNQQARGFALPPGDEADGKEAFVNLACDQCHSVGDVAWKGLEGTDIHVKLGGNVTSIKTYGELLTSVINPSHKISDRFRSEFISRRSQSPMPFYNHIMTVEELVDLVTFLEKQYALSPPTTYYQPF